MTNLLTYVFIYLLTDSNLGYTVSNDSMINK